MIEKINVRDVSDRSGIVVVSPQDHTTIRSFGRQIKSSEITTDGPIYFHKTSVFPRRRIKEILKNPIVRKPQKAEYVVINKKDFSVFHLGINSFFELDGKISYNTPIPYPNREGQHLTLHVAFSQKEIDIVNDFNFIYDKKIIFDDQLIRLIPREVEMKGDFYASLHKMFTTDDKQNIKLATEMICNVNYEEYRSEIMLLLNEFEGKIRSHCCNTSVAYKSLVKLMDLDIPYWNQLDNLTVALDLLDKGECSNIIQDHINKKLQRYHSLSNDKKYKVIIE